MLLSSCWIRLKARTVKSLDRIWREERAESFCLYQSFLRLESHWCNLQNLVGYWLVVVLWSLVSQQIFSLFSSLDNLSDFLRTLKWRLYFFVWNLSYQTTVFLYRMKHHERHSILSQSIVQDYHLIADDNPLPVSSCPLFTTEYFYTKNFCDSKFPFCYTCLHFVHFRGLLF